MPPKPKVTTASDSKAAKPKPNLASWGIVNGSGCGKAAMEDIQELQKLADRIKPR